MEVKLMRRREVCDALGISSATLHRGMEEGRFPRPYRTGQNSVRWKNTEIQECIDRLQVAAPVPVAPGASKGRKAKGRGL